MKEVYEFLENYFSNNKYISNLDELYMLLEQQNLNLKEQKEVLVKVYEHNKKVQKQEINKSNKLLEISLIQDEEEIIEFSKPKEKKNPEPLKMDVSEYLNEIKKAENEDEIIELLPKREDLQFDNILSMIIINLYKEKVEILNFIHSQQNMNEVQSMFQEDIDDIDSKIEYILDYKNYEEENEYEEKDNKIIFLKNSFNEPIVFNNLSGYEEYYDSFLELIDRIKKGKFKKMRNFTNNNKIVDIMEVKGFKTRILFARITDDIYVVLAAFVKKCDTNLRHRHFIENISSKYQVQKNVLLNNLENPNFMIEEDKYYQQLITMLSEKKKVKTNEIN